MSSQKTGRKLPKRPSKMFMADCDCGETAVYVKIVRVGNSDKFWMPLRADCLEIENGR